MRRYALTKPTRARGLHFTRCGTRLLVCGGRSAQTIDTAALLDLATGGEHSRIEQHGACYAVPPDASRFVLGGATTGSTELSGIVWSNLPDLTGWERQRWMKRSLPPRYPGVSGLAFDATGTRLAVAHSRPSGVRSNPHSPRPHLTITDPDTGEAEFNLPVTRAASLLAFSPDRARLATTGDSGVTVFELDACVPAFSFKPPSAIVHALRYCSDGRLAVANRATVFVLSAGGGQQFALHGHTQQVNALAVTPSGARLLSASDDGTVRAWDMRTGETVAEFDWKIGPVTALACAPDGLTCAAAGTGGNVVLWDADG